MAMPGYGVYDTESQEIENRRRYAEALQNQGMQQMPAGQMAGRVFVPASPLAGLAKVLQSYVGAKGVADASDERKALAGRVEGERSADMSAMVNALRGTPARPQQMSPDDMAMIADQGGQANPMVPAVPGDPNAAAMAALGSKFQDIRGMAPGMLAMGQKANQPYTLTPGAVRYGGDNQQLAAAPTAPKARTPSQLSTLQAERAALPPGDPRIQAYDNAIRKESETTKQISPTIVMPRADEPPVAVVTQDGKGVEFVSRANAIGRIPANMDAATQGNLAGAKAGGKVVGESGAEASISLPQVTSKAEQALGLIDQMVGSADGKVKPHPGFSSYVGGTLLPGMRHIEGSDTAGYQALENQVKGGAFLQAFEQLKGAGQITEVEGRKATEAITRMNKSQSESEYIKAAREFQNVIRSGVQRAKQRAGGDRRAAPREATRRVIVDY